MSLFSRYFDVPGGPNLPPATAPSVGGGGGSDHGGLTGLSDDDHPQYLLIDGSRAMTGGIALPSIAIGSAPNLVIFIDPVTGAPHFKNSGGTAWNLADNGSIAWP